MTVQLVELNYYFKVICVAFAGSQFANKGGADAAKSGTKATTGGKGDTTTGTALSETAPKTNCASTAAGISEGMKAFDIVTQVVQSLDPKAGAILNFIKGGNIDFSTAEATGGTFQNLISHYGKFKATEELQRFARKNGMSLMELNLALVTMSFVGNKLVGTRFNPSAKFTYKDGSISIEQVMFGMFGRQDIGTPIINSKKNTVLNRIIGTPFDVIDVVLGYTGILTASDYNFISHNDNINQKLLGHSLGTLGVSNLVARGYLGSNLAELYSLPFGNVAPSGIKLFIGTVDGVNGFIFGFLTNPSAEIVNGCWHTFQCYLNKTRSK